MERFADKLREARKAKGISQTELAEAVGITQRSMTNYERGAALPRKNMLRKLAEQLGVTVEYLSNDETNDPEAGRAREDRINAVREQFGSKGAREVDDLMQKNLAFFAGGDIDQEAKDAFFDALMTAYVTCKNEARAKFTPKSLQKQDKPDA